jgi:hypothetical protein
MAVAAHTAPPLCTSRRRPADYDICPHPLQRALAYLANGDLPPLPRLTGPTWAGFTALCFAGALVIGGAQ